ncbi:MAG: hypothetical protein ACI88L_000182 [Candidatus Paceibacteria bacterium]|jgi:hypothetical protein
MEWLKKLIPSLGLLIGIIFVAIGSTMLISSTFKLVFDVSISYDTRFGCENKYSPQLEKEIEQTPEQIETCKEEIIETEHSRFVAQKTEDIIDGAAFLLVGTFFWVFFWKRRD